MARLPCLAGPPQRGEALQRRDAGVARTRAATEERSNAERPLGGEHGPSPAPRRAWPSQNLVGLIVLVVDDDEGSRDYFAMALRTAGAAVVTASSAEEAVASAREHPP